jgi:chitodextrinase
MLERLGSEVRLTWRTGVDDVGVAGYELYRNGVLLATTASTSHIDTSTRTGIAYAYRVRVFDAAGNFSAFSNPRSVLR